MVKGGKVLIVKGRYKGRTGLFIRFSPDGLWVLVDLDPYEEEEYDNRTWMIRSYIAPVGKLTEVLYGDVLPIAIP